ncbi:MAG: hypothetical protein K0R29_1680 [Pseudobdellovibrio sp.]|jgi:CBS domain containing-hemolysin-like protein|nr:hypothetical protein [Pseudobdellovibrio sp.]
MEPPLPNLTETLFFVFISLVLVFLNGFFVAAEFAIVKVRRTRLKELEGQGIGAARVSIMMVDQLDEHLSATQLGITLVSLALGWAGEESFYNLMYYAFPAQAAANSAQFHAIALGASFFVITLLHVVLGELVPKSMAIQRAEQMTLLVARPLRWFFVMAKPLIIAFTAMANLILRLLGFKGEEDTHLSEEELKMVLQDSHDEGVITDSEAQIIRRAFEFSDKRVRDIMIPEPEVQMLKMGSTFDDNFRMTQKRMYTRFPLVKGSFQDVVGIVHIKDAFLRLKSVDDNSIFTLAARPAIYVDPALRQDRLMKVLNEKRTHMAIVRDPQTKENLGIVTLEDILEDLVGDIVDEHGN